MTKKSIIGLAALMAAISFTGCNSDYESGENVSSSVAVHSFSLTDDNKILENLDSVFFSINLNTGEIFNADSLPYGTKTSKLIPVIRTVDNVAVMNLHVTRANKADTTYNYLTSPNDSIDFSNGPVRLQIISPDGTIEKNYTIKVNVHQMKTDSLAWVRSQRRNLPSTFSVPNQQHTTASTSDIYCLTRYGAQYCIARSEDAAEWTYTTPGFGFTPDVDSFTATESNGLFILSDDGALYRSENGGQTWTATGDNWKYIYGAFGDTLYGNTRDAAGKWLRVSYPASVSEAIPEDFPVSGTSAPVMFSFPMSGERQSLMIGGRLANGELTNAVWGFDGTNWMKLGQSPAVKRLEGMVMVPYFTFKIDNAWIATRYAALLAFGGRSSDGTPARTMYISTNYGITWRVADTLMQLPDYIPDMYGAQALVRTSVLTPESRSENVWTDFHDSRIRPGARFDYPSEWLPEGLMSTYATQAPTSWECPYIYLFGGLSATGTTYNTVWRGAINRMTFEPLY